MLTDSDRDPEEEAEGHYLLLYNYVTWDWDVCYLTRAVLPMFNGMTDVFSITPEF